MSLKKCKECKKEVSSYASKCPGCGANNPTTGAKEFFAGLGFVVFLGWIFYINVIDKADPQTEPTTKAVVAKSSMNSQQEQPRTPPLAVVSVPPPHKATTLEDIVTANDFCKESSELYGKIDSSLKRLQSGISNSKKNKSPEVLVNTIQSFMLRSSELQDDAASLSPPGMDLEGANLAMADMTASVQGVAQSNASAAENLRALFSSEQSMERTLENAKQVGETRDYFNLKYSLSVLKLFEVLGYKASDLSDKTMCLKSSTLSRLTGEPA
ncbi:hypothetical protein QN366_04795 [Pseudomonas sp. CCC3.2]|uniref:hypothetical protein n=1 Tax=unclassified Pseudomonas TaxID=196821 RepID=UPI002AB5510F|nr:MULTISPECIES: hypothetical protein [unclassified Pseudomonas]MDY7559969.1 hypothetical protein [Pseudomonas sp. AB6]MEA9994532.1 hypothetical protein [Pseudomonas sp. AA4]MEB0085676.1 hypothetical protein [Pseudomonas sp. RTI1]MEB0125998.1 hypothetical protein [Pseudomonas sp. CCC1.2]MEB0152803.1 hypothetical protein [Pseudomonas sp. CCC4.3]